MAALLLAVMLIAGRAADACDCSAGPLSQAFRISAAVFTGKVVAIRKLKSTEHGRQRYIVVFAATRWWKGPGSSHITIHDAQPRGDCQGFGFQAGQEYVVFARSRAVQPDAVIRIDGQEVAVSDIWKGVVPIGAHILAGEICSWTEELTRTRAGETVRLLDREHGTR